jgi:hypothetical protein
MRLLQTSAIIDLSAAQFVIFGGDLNVNIECKSPHALAINDFLGTYKLKNGLGLLEQSVKSCIYTFSNEELGRHSTIDFLCVSETLLDCVTSYYVIHGAINHSDHLPVSIVLSLPKCSDLYTFYECGSVGKPSVSMPDKKNEQPSLRWDKVNIDQYYAYTGQLLYPIYNDLLHCVNENVTIPNSAIEILYNNTVGALVTASESCIPRIPKQSLKFWWSTDLTNLKKQSRIFHKIWEDAGKPISGSLFETKNKDKYLCKHAIKKAKCDNTSNVSNDLHEFLSTKNSTCFWKTWKNKICNTVKK